MKQSRTTGTTNLHDPKVNVNVVLSGLWISMLFVFAYVDIFSFWRDDVINGALDGTVPGAGFEIDQTFLALTTVYILIPSLMVTVSLLAPPRINRTTNIVVSLLYTVSVIVSIRGETWVYFILGSVVEVALLLTIARVAWAWPRRPAGNPPSVYEPVENAASPSVPGTSGTGVAPGSSPSLPTAPRPS